MLQGSGNVLFEVFASETNLFQQLNQNQMMLLSLEKRG
jgi:hypothetical protein